MFWGFMFWRFCVEGFFLITHVCFDSLWQWNLIIQPKAFDFTPTSKEGKAKIWVNVCAACAAHRGRWPPPVSEPKSGVEKVEKEGGIY